MSRVLADPIDARRGPTESSRVLGVDPGLRCTGYGIVEIRGPQLRLVEAGVIRPSTNGTLADRLAELFQGLCELLAEHSPQVMAVEQLYSHYARPRTAILMGHARGVICLSAAQRGLPVHHYAATKIKKILTGSGHASKAQMQGSIQREFALSGPPEPHDVADALAVALCHIFSTGLNAA